MTARIDPEPSSALLFAWVAEQKKKNGKCVLFFVCVLLLFSVF